MSEGGVSHACFKDCGIAIAVAIGLCLGLDIDRMNDRW